ncbi:MAG: hypothetical protein LBN95_10435 [Prevotellaceae bacterium]|jgi:hypothetical protein|nr:hypothetical protein [Prevotellaceae bacterium]
MDEIIKLVAKKAKISEPIARIAVETVLGVVKDKLPDNLEGIIDNLLGTKSSTGKKTSAKSSNPLGDIGNIIGGIGGILGKK